MEAVEGGSPGKGLRSRQHPVGVGHAVVMKMRCPFSGIGSGRQG